MNTVKQTVEQLPPEYRDCFVIGFAAIIRASSVHNIHDLRNVLDTEDYPVAFMIVKHLVGKVIDPTVTTVVTLFGETITITPTEITLSLIHI